MTKIAKIDSEGKREQRALGYVRNMLADPDFRPGNWYHFAVKADVGSILVLTVLERGGHYAFNDAGVQHLLDSGYIGIVALVSADGKMVNVELARKVKQTLKDAPNTISPSKSLTKGFNNKPM